MDSGPSATTTARQYDPHSGRGRHKTNLEPASKRVSQNRENQRALRERKAQFAADQERKIQELSLKVQELTASTPDGLVIQLDIYKQRISDLEAECEALKATNNSTAFTLPPLAPQPMIPLVPCASCASERLKTSICMDQISALEAQNLDLQNKLNLCQSSLNFTNSIMMNAMTQFQSQIGTASAFNAFGPQHQSTSIFSPTNTPSTLLPLSDNSELMDIELDKMFDQLIPAEERNKSSEELYGPPEVESAKIAMKSVPSLKNSPTIDQAFDFYVEISKVRDPKEARKLVFKSTRAGMKILDECSLLDRAKVIEIFSVFHERNAKHEKHFSILSAPVKPAMPPPPLDLSKLRPIILLGREALRSIVSFQSAEAYQLIDEMCQMSDTFTSESFFKVKHILYQLDAMAQTVEDRAKLMTLMEVAKESNRQQFDNMVASMEKSSLSD